MIKIIASKIECDYEAKEYEKAVNTFLKKHKLINSINNVVIDRYLYTIIWYQK